MTSLASKKDDIKEKLKDLDSIASLYKKFAE